MRVSDSPTVDEGNLLDDTQSDVADGKVVLLGLGNPYMKDDGAGILIAGELKKRDLGRGVLVLASRFLDASLIWQVRNAAAIVIIDALRSGAPVGTVSRFSLTSRRTPMAGLPSLHELQLHDLVDLAGLDAVSCPLAIVAVEPKDCGIGEGLTKELIAAVPKAVDEAAELAKDLVRKRQGQ
jgi:hydrogenase maturation protease